MTTTQQRSHSARAGRILAYLLLLLISLGFLSVTARICATGSCFPHLAVMLGLSALSILLVLLSALLVQLAPAPPVARIEPALGALLLATWTVLLGLSMSAAESLPHSRASYITAFAWVAEALALAILAAAVVAATAPQTSQVAHKGPVAVPGDVITAGAALSQSAVPPFQRDGVPEAQYMGAAVSPPAAAARTDNV